MTIIDLAGWRVRVACRPDALDAAVAARYAACAVSAGRVNHWPQWVQCKVLRGVLRRVMLSGSTTQRGLRRLTSEASVPFVQRKLCSKWTDASLVDRCGVPWVVDPLSMTEGRLPGQRMCPRKTLNHTHRDVGLSGTPRIDRIAQAVTEQEERQHGEADRQAWEQSEVKARCAGPRAHR